jgi:hypothetical protein
MNKIRVWVERVWVESREQGADEQNSRVGAARVFGELSNTRVWVEPHARVWVQHVWVESRAQGADDQNCSEDGGSGS